MVEPPDDDSTRNDRHKTETRRRYVQAFLFFGVLVILALQITSWKDASVNTTTVALLLVLITVTLLHRIEKVILKIGDTSLELGISSQISLIERQFDLNGITQKAREIREQTHRVEEAVETVFDKFSYDPVAALNDVKQRLRELLAEMSEIENESREVRTDGGSATIDRSQQRAIRDLLRLIERTVYACEHGTIRQADIRPVLELGLTAIAFLDDIVETSRDVAGEEFSSGRESAVDESLTDEVVENLSDETIRSVLTDLWERVTDEIPWGGSSESDEPTPRIRSVAHEYLNIASKAIPRVADPEDRVHWFVRSASVAYRIGDAETARSNLSSAREVSTDSGPDTDIGWLREGARFLMSDVTGEVEVTEESRGVPFHENCARALVEHGIVTDVDQYYQHLLGHDPDDPTIRRAYAWFLVAHDRIDDADQQYQAAVERNPDTEWLRRDYARFLAEQDRIDDADEQYQAALERNHSYIRRDYASFLADQDRIDDADEQYQAAIERDPDNPDVRRAYARFLAEQDRTDDADEQFQAAIERNPGNEWLRKEYAEFLRAQGRDDEAEELYQ